MPTPEHEIGHRGQTGRRQRALPALVLVMILIGFALHTTQTDLPALEAPFAIPWWALAALFLLVEMLVIHILVRRDAHSLSLTEFPMLLGLVFASPQALIMARLIGSGSALLVHRHQTALKLAFNLALFYVETTFAVAVYRGLVSDSPNSPYGWLIALVTMGAVAVIGSGLVTAAIAMHDRNRELRAVARAVAGSLLTTLVAGILALMVVIVLWSDGRAVTVIAVMFTALYLAFRLYGSLNRRYEELLAIYSFTQTVDVSASADNVIRTTLVQCRELLRADIAYAVLLDEPGASRGRRITLAPDGSLSAEPADEEQIAELIVSCGESGRISGRHDGERRTRAVMAAGGIHSGLVAPLRGESGPGGFLVLGNRLGPGRKFTADDLRLLEAITSHANASYQRNSVLERLSDEVEQKHELMRSKDELIASVSHELRTPLTAVVDFSELLRDKASTLSHTEQSELVDSIANEALDISTIVEDLLAVARSELGVLNLEMGPIDVCAQVDQVLDLWPEERSIRLELPVGEVVAFADPVRLRQILRNLIVNALRYGGGTVWVKVAKHGSLARVDISDNGPGIPEPDRERIFEPYQRAHDPGTQPGSVGLGLTISRRLARKMGGDLVYQWGNGESKFTLTVPLAAAKALASAESAEHPTFEVAGEVPAVARPAR